MTDNLAEQYDPADEAAEADLNQFVTFCVGKDMFAVPMAPVQEIIRVPDAVRVPLAPDSLAGLANRRGRVLPIISLRHIFAMPERPYDEATRAVVVDLGSPLGFVVDRVASVVTVDPDAIEPVSHIQGAVQTELLTGVIKNIGGHAMTLVVDFDRLIEREFAAIARIARQGERLVATLGDDADNDAEDDSDELQLVSFGVEGQEYAIDIASVQEIVQVPGDIVQVPNSDSHVLGLMTLRNRLLPLVSLRRMFRLSDTGIDEHHRIVVLALGQGYSVGVVTDSVNEVLRVRRTVVDEMPPILAREGDLNDISSICRLDDGKRLVSILSVERMFDHPALREALQAVKNAGGPSLTDPSMNEDELDRETADGGEDEEQTVVFRLGAEEFGVPIMSVQEIVRVPENLTLVPKSPAFVEGVINLRGQVLPVIDQRRRFDLPEAERNDRQRIMVYLLNGTRTGFIVDSVAEVLKVPHDCIEPAPTLSDAQAGLIQRVANLDKQKRLIMLIDPDRLLASDEVDALTAVGQAG